MGQQRRHYDAQYKADVVLDILINGKSYGEEIARDIGLMPEKIDELVSRRAEKQGYAEIMRR